VKVSLGRGRFACITGSSWRFTSSCGSAGKGLPNTTTRKVLPSVVEFTEIVSWRIVGAADRTRATSQRNQRWDHK
jgi:hypothetical protein